MHPALEPLETEIEAFEDQLPVLRQRYAIGTYVLFAGSQLIGNYKSFREALKAGYDAVGLTPFLVMQICPQDQEVEHVYRAA